MAAKPFLVDDSRGVIHLYILPAIHILVHNSETIHGPAKCKVDTLAFSSVAMPRLLGLSCFR